MILGFDVGNTTTVVGCYNTENDEPFASLRIMSEVRITRDELFHKLSSLLQRKGISLSGVEGIIYSSVVPALDSIYHRLFRDELGLEPVVVDVYMNSGLEFRYDNLRDIGADRIVNASGAYHFYHDKGNLIIIDFGTATTFCVILEEGVYQGGIIAPGLNMSMDALFSRTAKLPNVSFSKPPFVVGTSTVNSIQSGFYYGWISMIQGIISLIQQQLQRDFFVLLTGGYAQEIGASVYFDHLVDENLTLKGLKLLYDKNQ